ncbi:hypothetical protein FQN50_002879 [Emmonsiellopsis sp. PD_5]|nr:hypothetical protein FQN50_002879 [Emmonsiellopsis sp. PD_5]
MSKEIDDYKDYKIKTSCYQNGWAANFEKPHHITKIIDLFCDFGRYYMFGYQNSMIQFPRFQNLSEDPWNTQIHVTRFIGNSEAPPPDIPLDRDICIKLFNGVLTICPGLTGSDLAHFGGGSATVIDPVGWSVAINCLDTSLYCSPWHPMSTYANQSVVPNGLERTRTKSRS